MKKSPANVPDEAHHDPENVKTDVKDIDLKSCTEIVYEKRDAWYSWC